MKLVGNQLRREYDDCTKITGHFARYFVVQKLSFPGIELQISGEEMNTWIYLDSGNQLP